MTRRRLLAIAIALFTVCLLWGRCNRYDPIVPANPFGGSYDVVR